MEQKEKRINVASPFFSFFWGGGYLYKICVKFLKYIVYVTIVSPLSVFVIRCSTCSIIKISLYLFESWKRVGAVYKLQFNEPRSGKNGTYKHRSTWLKSNSRDVNLHRYDLQPIAWESLHRNTIASHCWQYDIENGNFLGKMYQSGICIGERRRTDVSIKVLFRGPRNQRRSSRNCKAIPFGERGTVDGGRTKKILE